MTRLTPRTPDPRDPALQVYLLGEVDFDAALRFQHRLRYEISGDRDQAALILCEHPPLISVGRRGSHAHLRYDEAELRARRWPVRWVNRGGGCFLHLPGQLAVYPILPLDRLGLGVRDYLHRLGATIHDLVTDFSIRSPLRVDEAGVWVGDRLLAAFGVAVRDWVGYFGAYINLHPPLEPFRFIDVVPGNPGPMTSLTRERRGLVRPSLVRERLIEHFQNRFGFRRLALFSDHPALQGDLQRCREQPKVKGIHLDRA